MDIVKHHKVRARAGRPRIALLTCLWQRPNLSEVVLGYYQDLRSRLSREIDLVLMAVGSEGDASRQLAERFDFRYVEHPNHPLGAKWNAGMNALRDKNVDAVVTVGSDDLVDERMFYLYAAQLERGVKFMGAQDIHLVELPSRRMVQWFGYRGSTGPETIGPGRCIAAEWLERLDWQLWDDEQEDLLDGSAHRRLEPLFEEQDAEWVTYSGDTNCLTVVSVKTGSELWSFEACLRDGEHAEIDSETFLRAHFPAQVVNQLMVFDPGLPVDTSLVEAEVARLVSEGEALFEEGRLDEAEWAFLSALYVDPNNATALNDLGVLNLQLDRANEAVEYFSRALEADPKDRDVLCNVAEVLGGLGHWEAPLPLLEDYLQENPDDFEVRQLYDVCMQEAAHAEVAVGGGN